MLDFEKLSIWAARIGLLGSFFITLLKYENSDIDSYTPALAIAAIIAWTFAPTQYHDLVRRYAPIILWNTVGALTLLFIVFATAVLGLLVHEQILPAFASLLRVSELSSAWIVVALLFLIIPNIKVLFEILSKVLFEILSTQTT